MIKNIISISASDVEVKQFFNQNRDIFHDVVYTQKSKFKRHK